MKRKTYQKYSSYNSHIKNKYQKQFNYRYFQYPEKIYSRHNIYTALTQYYTGRLRLF